MDRNGGHYCGLTLNWHYKDNYVDVLMPGFVTKSLKKFQHTAPVKPQYAPHKWNQPTYGQKVQYAPPPDASDALDKSTTGKIQAIVGTFLYYGRAIDGTILPTVNEILANQSKPTINTAK